jgi:hypothetical protein
MRHRFSKLKTDSCACVCLDKCRLNRTQKADSPTQGYLVDDLLTHSTFNFVAIMPPRVLELLLKTWKSHNHNLVTLVRILLMAHPQTFYSPAMYCSVGSMFSIALAVALLSRNVIRASPLQSNSVNC